MAMHGKYGKTKGSTISKADLAFVAANYGTISTGTGCGATVNKTKGSTIEDSVLATAAGIKAANPEALVGMYYRSGFASEVALSCTPLSSGCCSCCSCCPC